MNKKAQTEDVFAELIISVIFILIGIYALSSVLDMQQLTLKEKESSLDLMIEKDYLSLGNYVNYEYVDFNGEEIPFKDFLRKSYTDETYKEELVDMLENQEFFFTDKRGIFDQFVFNVSYPGEDITYYYKEGDINGEIKDVYVISHEKVVLPLEDHKQVIVTLNIVGDQINPIQNVFSGGQG